MSLDTSHHGTYFYLANLFKTLKPKGPYVQQETVLSRSGAHLIRPIRIRAISSRNPLGSNMGLLTADTSPIHSSPANPTPSGRQRSKYRHRPSNSARPTSHTPGP